MIKAVTFNMQNGEPWTGCDSVGVAPQIDRTLEFLTQTDADFLFLQEVERGKDGGGQEIPPPNFQRITEALPDYCSHFSYPPDNPDELPFGLGVAILSRFPISGRREVVLPAPDLEFEFGGRKRRPSRRVLIEVVAETESGSVRLLNTHLQAFFMVDADPVDHPGQRSKVLEVLNERDMPTILAGDFNCAAQQGVVGYFGRAGYRTAQNSEITWWRRPYILDHLFSNAYLEVLDAGVIRTTVSDHHAVRATYRIVGS